MTEKKDHAIAVMHRLVEVLRKAGHIVRGDPSSWICHLYIGKDGDVLPVEVKNSTNDSWHFRPTGKVTVSVQRNYRAIWYRTRASWTDEQIAEVAEKVVDEYKAQKENERIEEARRKSKREFEMVIKTLRETVPTDIEMEAKPDRIRVSFETQDPDLILAVSDAFKKIRDLDFPHGDEGDES
jgi:hypothetical protein